MQLAQLNLPARMTARDHFATVYAAAHTAADRITKFTDDLGQPRPDLDHEAMRRIVNNLSQALCAARELDNLLAGNQPPKRGG